MAHSEAKVERTPSARERARRAMIEDIVAVARRQLAAVGAAGLSVREVTRELGIASSAIYRYFPTRDDLLTELIMRGYGDLGACAEQAEARVDRGDLRGRFRAVFAAARTWALEHPHEWGLLYGTPVPGYHAPEGTKDPAGRVASVLVGIYRDLIASPGWSPDDVARVRGGVAEASDVEPIAPDAIASARAFVGTPAPTWVIVTGLVAWTWMNGVISAEMWGHLTGSVDDPAEFYRAAVERFADGLGMP